MTSTISPHIPPLRPTHPLPNHDNEFTEYPSTSALITALSLLPHIEGGYFSEIDRNPLTIPNPFLTSSGPETVDIGGGRTALLPRNEDDTVRNASTSIYYLLTRARPQGGFHRNKGRTVHSVVRGRGRYVIIHADEVLSSSSGAGGVMGKARVETFVVGKDVLKGEVPCWIVEGGKYKASFLLEGHEGDEDVGLLITETVVPGFEYADHDFLTGEGLEKLVSKEQYKELWWLLRRGERVKARELV